MWSHMTRTHGGSGSQPWIFSVPLACYRDRTGSLPSFRENFAKTRNSFFSRDFVLGVLEPKCFASRERICVRTGVDQDL